MLLLIAALSGCGGTGRTIPNAALSRMSNRGVPEDVRSPQEIQLLVRAKADPRSLRLLATRQGISILTSRSTGPGPCFLTRVPAGFGLISCGPNKYPFPSSRLPAIDLSSLSARPGQRHPLVTTLTGIAADGVSRVAVRFVRGPDYVAPVVGNTYIERHVPQRPALMIVALDRQGRALIKFPLPVPPISASQHSH
jgi:hypothetical protein